ncbi:MAG: YdiU family protein [Rhodobacteraceae bacterium]|nr:YdiU family protein [Paracoccaceae bacterium]
MTFSIPFDNSYATLPDRFYTRTAPTPVANPGLITVNEALARDLDIDPQALASPEGLQVLAGNAVPQGADPLAQVYAGQQFGNWVPQLGDGRAILLGEVLDNKGKRRDLQLKGAGLTPYSRGGDGRAWLGPVLREYIVSEAMHALGIPTTRALAAVTTGETVVRETLHPGAILTRVASSHIRVGTFQYFAARADTEALQALTGQVIARHYPEAEHALDMLDSVIAAQARLVAQWMGVGFIHGVMNTDNTHIAGETIDYGPCAFMDGYHPDTVFSSIDRNGRYAYGRQPQIAVWNLAQLATALLPLIDDDQDRAVQKATMSVHRFPDLYRAAWQDVFRAKLGLQSAVPGDADLIEAMLAWMAAEKADFTNTFRDLCADREPRVATCHEDWQDLWQRRRARDFAAPDRQQALMRLSNPAVIPRNHRVEKVIHAALSDDCAPFFRLISVLRNPFDLASADADFALPPRPQEVVHQTFCGT